ncbi:hypothetical protein OEZ60_06290 [Defluviimonas sp. WL0024]|uniref:Uncharacterized protein n=1 Tax=Albidovulum salinarum TaxID=2984153 RepID=A0ABT2X113_9RHOB|nr:hypothetical protein [Defluviimonas sp. WL0024]MCU9847611.1 hypothetical protein [Defluviimonas sp. WL0024]
MPTIDWVSPLAEDDYAEYRDGAFLERLGIDSLCGPLKDFWPQRGPQWDALGLTSSGPVLVEAKAHIREFFSPPSQASETSKKQINSAFAAVCADLGINRSTNWCELYYQYANRLAFLWWLRENGVDANLLFVSFLNDCDMGGPSHIETWKVAFDSANYVLGLPERNKLGRYIHHVSPDIRELN